MEEESNLAMHQDLALNCCNCQVLREKKKKAPGALHSGMGVFCSQDF